MWPAGDGRIQEFLVLPVPEVNPAVAHGHLQDGGDVQVAHRGQVSLIVGQAAPAAATGGIVAGNVQRHAGGDVVVINSSSLKNLGQPYPTFTTSAGGPEQLIRGIGVNPQADIGILEGELLLGAEDEVGQWIGGVPAVRGQAAQGKGLKVGVASWPPAVLLPGREPPRPP